MPDLNIDPLRPLAFPLVILRVGDPPRWRSFLPDLPRLDILVIFLGHHVRFLLDAGIALCSVKFKLDVNPANADELYWNQRETKSCLSEFSNVKLNFGCVVNEIRFCVPKVSLC